ncbi:cation/H+ exchanger [Neolentinus lepideus HHB14362 ss-1]|uniref:Cation/H+ exchanger n=1 Tax=Neolentinus lepideus HHB14362 ss-1 TaxID=1314782 RepID=A0A165V9E1_9AGAM|nr:cation/H+ exchanger [Neolentinus lepideus HHB14362 ss-1]
MRASNDHLLSVGKTLAGRAAPEQAGLFVGLNPSVYNPNDPIVLWVIQVVIIIGSTQLLSLLLGRIRQPRVIAEVITGVILGPSIMGRIPGFTAAIFPTVSIPMLDLTATIGLVLFLFLVGLEIDFRVVKRNAKASAAISVAGLVLPLGLGAALAVPLYHQFVDDSVNYGYFILFTAVAIGITAFPVLCRILTELNLLDTTVGVLVLSAGVGNDVVGWVLLALSVALVNASSGLTALWVLLTAVGYVLFLLLPVKWAFRWLAKRTGSLETGQPTAFMTTVTLLVVFISAFFTDIIGIHPIFGGFVAGLIIPRENGFAISLTEKLEDLVSLLFLPLYFTYSGLRTNLGLLNNGITWGYVFLICAVAFFSKFIGCFTSAKLCGFSLRESGAVGSLMSCKGLVELIVLNVGYQAGILDTRTFSMFVIHALILTFITTPLTLLWYPPKYRSHWDAVQKKAANQAIEEGTGASTLQDADEFKTRFTVVLDAIEQLPAAMTLTKCLQQTSADVGRPLSTISETSDRKGSDVPTTQFAAVAPAQHQISVDALRLIELTDRTSAVLKSQHADSLIERDPVVSVFRTFGFLNGLSVNAALSVVPPDEFTSSIVEHVRGHGSQMVVIPLNASLFHSSAEPVNSASPVAIVETSYNPFDSLFQRSTSPEHASPVVYSPLVRSVFTDIPSDVALFIDRTSASLASPGPRQIFLPFFGGPDDRLALSFVMQLCMNPDVTATVVKIMKQQSNELEQVDTIEAEKIMAVHSYMQTTILDTAQHRPNTTAQLASETADNLLWSRYFSPSTPLSPEVASAVGRITFRHEFSSLPLHAVLDFANQVTSGPLCVIMGRSRRYAGQSNAPEFRQLASERGLRISSDLIKTMGDAAAAVVTATTSCSVLVLQASS